MEFSYKKNDNQKLFKSLEENPSFGLLKPQNYIPIYNRYFSLSETTHNAIGLNNSFTLSKLISQETNNIFKCNVKSANDDKKHNKKVYLKFSPLLDPLKYLLGKYDMDDSTLLNLPSFDVSDSSNKTCHSKVLGYNNSAYVDSFFTYLSSKLLHDYGFIHGLDFYGSFLAIKTDFRINVIDDIDYLNDAAFFRRNDKILYELEDIPIDEADCDTRNYKKKLKFEEEPIEKNELNNERKTILNLADITDLTQLDSIVNVEELSNTSELEIITLDDIKIDKNNSTRSSHSSCSSRTSNTTGEPSTNDDIKDEADEADEADVNEKSGEDEGSQSGSGSGSSGSGGSDDGEEEVLIAKIKQFPVQVIALEHCENTLDYLMSHEDIADELWDSIVLQILFSLITFQKTFSLTHNDLHTNNVMYVETDKPFLFYKLNHVYYKVPTFGKLFKIIDFGRAIYKFRGQTLCSDSFHPDGDAATQYNCEPYINNKKPRLEPNYSFDLCRLGCALYDYLIDEPSTKIVQIMLDWITDDKGRNILYKKNGDERYPDFKLYKMIARTVNKHIPSDVLSNAYFDKFIINKKGIKKTTVVMDLDAIPYLGGSAPYDPR
jgi:hypothetical protein